MKKILSPMIYLFLSLLLIYPITGSATKKIFLFEKEKKEFSIKADRYLSPYFGSSLIFSARNLYLSINPYITNTNQEPLSRLLRANRLLLEFAALPPIIIIQHEVFGHGYRMREFDVENRQYHIEYTNGWTSGDYINHHEQEKATISFGGTEANFIVSRELSMQFLNNETINPLDGLLYFMTYMDKTQYILFVNNMPSHDFYHYISHINNIYGPNTLTMDKLKTRTYLDFFDPFLVYSIMAAGHHLLNGEPEFEYPMLQVGKIDYLPGFRSIITPFGPEIQSIHYFRYNKMYGRFYLNYGDTADKNSYGIGAEINNLFGNDILSIGIRGFIWDQPELLTPDPKKAKEQFGVFFSTIGNINVVNNFYINAELGYKTKGFIVGEQLKDSIVAKLGVQLTL